MMFLRADVLYGGDELLNVVSNGLLRDVNSFVNSGSGGLHSSAKSASILSVHHADAETPDRNVDSETDADLGSNSHEETTANNFYTPSECEFSAIYGLRIYRNGSIIAPRKFKFVVYMKGCMWLIVIS